MLFRRAPQKVEELKIVIVGAGEVGFHIAQRLSEEQKQVVVIDQNPDKLRRIEDNMDVQTVLGSGSIPSVLKNAGAGDAAEMLEALVDEESLVAGKRVHELGLPKGILLLGVIRGGEAFIPSGQTVIQPQDRIVLLSLREKMSKLEGIVSKKKE